MVLLFKFLK